MTKKKKVYFGIDPGSDGYITAFDGQDFSFYAMPKYKVDSGHKLKSGNPRMKWAFHEAGLKNVVEQINSDFEGCEMIFGIEDVGGQRQWGVSRNFQFGVTAGEQRMIPIMLGAEFKMISVKTWQGFMRKPYSELKKRKDLDSKQIAEIIAKTEFPEVEFVHSKIKKTVHDGQVDSFLICVYLYRTLNK